MFGEEQCYDMNWTMEEVVVGWHKAEMENVSGSGSLEVSGMGSCYSREDDIPSHNIHLRLRLLIYCKRREDDL